MTGVTHSEVFHQPDLWVEIFHSIGKQRSEIQSFLGEVLKPATQIIVSGAGSSAFVGEMTAGFLQNDLQRSCRAIATTDIVTHPELHIPRFQPLLFISYARSGDSPESVAAVERVNAINPLAHHLIITCNANGALAKMSFAQRSLKIILPEKANDRGLAMIGSVTGMVLASIMIGKLVKSTTATSAYELTKLISKAADAGRDIVAKYDAQLQTLGKLQFERAICLGSGPLLGMAREAHLKIQELSDGQVTGHFDSFLGFRHGPKALVNHRTLLIYFLSSSPSVSRYELDLIEGIRRDHVGVFTIAIVPEGVSLTSDLTITVPTDSGDFSILPMLIPAQLLAVYKSMNLGLNPDSPSIRGAIHRVVQGVTIYPIDL